MSSYDPLDDLPWSIRQSRFRVAEGSPDPSHFSLVSNTPESTRYQQVSCGASVMISRRL